MSDSSQKKRRGPRVDLTGKVFGRLTVIAKSDRTDNGVNFPFWTCRCECGTEKTVNSSALVGGLTTSCGCKRAANFLKDGLTITYPKEYRIWLSMIQRCTNPNSQRWDCYGARGISVCQRWAKSFAAFIDDMGPKPSSEHSIERRDNDGNYCPENCYWATRAEQSRNKRTNRYIEHQGKKLTIAEWSRETGISADVISHRRSLGWTPEDIFGTPVGEFAHTRARNSNGQFLPVCESTDSRRWAARGDGTGYHIKEGA